MAVYNCTPAARTVPPCPSGTAPDSQEIISQESPNYYPSFFDHVPTQDLQVGIAMIMSLILGVMSGRK